MERIFPTEKLIPTLLWPFTGLATGTPVLVRKLTAPQRERRAEAAALKAKQGEFAAQAAQAAEEAFTKKLATEADPAKRAAMLQAREAAQVTARQFELEQAKAARKAARSRAGDAAGAAALMLIVGGPLVWSLARPWIEPGIGLLIGAWWIAALIHAPAPAKTTPAEADQEDQEQGQPIPVPPEEEPAEEDFQEAPEAAAPTPADARHAVALLGADGTHVALTAVTAHLAAAHPRWERSGKATKALLTQAGIRYRDGVRVNGISVPGIHHDDVPPLPSPSESAPDGVVVAGQSNNNNHNNAREWTTREGFVMRTDPDNPARTIIVNPAPAA
ncbi:hypothetical protein ACGF13_01255 [Kitasatospora sp. NPDC048286]|uniref:hypothetical protein n=1 Tax=unclassified Kitasatospora TaxID=2633591 RepID=UPI00371DDAA1